MHTDSRHVARPRADGRCVLALHFECACVAVRVTARTGRRAYPTAYDRVTVRVQRTTAMATAGAGDPGRTRGVAVSCVFDRSFLCMLHMESLDLEVDIASDGDAPDRPLRGSRSGGGLLRSRRSRPHGRAVWQKLTGAGQRAVFTGTGPKQGWCSNC